MRISILFTFCSLAAGLLLGQAQRTFNPAKPEVLTLPLLPEGFATPQVTVQAGIYWIDVLNRSSVRGLSIQIDKVPGADLQAPATAHAAAGPEDQNRSRFLQTVTLTSGTYRVSIMGYPKWVCAINVK